MAGRVIADSLPVIEKSAMQSRLTDGTNPHKPTLRVGLCCPEINKKISLKGFRGLRLKTCT